MKLVLLGTGGGPRPARFRAAPSQAVVVDDRVYVIDCGNGVARQAATAGLDLRRLAAVLVTHHHIDHTADVGVLPLLAWTVGLDAPVRVLGPPPLGRIMDHFLGMTEEEVAARTATTGRRPFPELLQVEEVPGPGVVVDDGHVRVTAAVVDHPPLRLALAFRLDAPAGSVVVSGDTRPCERLVELARGADVLVHEAIYEPMLEVMALGASAPRILEHLRGCHTTAEQAGAVAAQAGVGTLVLSHLVPGGPEVPEEAWRSAAAATFGGRIVVGRDLLELPTG